MKFTTSPSYGWTAAGLLWLSLAGPVLGADFELASRAAKSAKAANLAKVATSGGLSTSVLAKVKANLAKTATDNWVAGTECEALLELDYPKRSVFASKYYTTTSPVSAAPNSIIKTWYNKRTSSTVGFVAASTSSSTDPAALGVSWIMAEPTVGSLKAKYTAVVEQEITFLNSINTTPEGAVSARPNDQPVALWSDFVYMAPPFWAYYGATQKQSAYIDKAYDQISLYRDALVDSETGLWRHIASNNSTIASDVRWSTGNGWAAAGMIRVLATIAHSPYASAYATQTANLAAWTTHLITSAFAQSLTDGFLPNEYDVAMSATFSDGSSTALLTSVAYRLATLGHIPKTGGLIAKAEELRLAVEKGIGNDGWLTPVVKPRLYKAPFVAGKNNPQSGAFVLLMEAAWKDWKATF